MSPTIGASLKFQQSQSGETAVTNDRYTTFPSLPSKAPFACSTIFS